MGQAPEVEYSATRAGGQSETDAFYHMMNTEYEKLQKSYQGASDQKKAEICELFNGEDVSLGQWKLQSLWADLTDS